MQKVELPFSKRMTTAAIVFACISADRDVKRLTSPIQQPAEFSTLAISYSSLLCLYSKLIRQDVPCQHALLDYLIAQASLVIGQLNTAAQSVVPPKCKNDADELANLQLVIANAVTLIGDVMCNTSCTTLVGPAGPAGAQGPTGPTGPAGPPGPSGSNTVPWHDIQDFGGLPLATPGVQANNGSTTATTVSGSPNVTLADDFFHLYQHLTNGQGICIWAAGAATAQSTPSAPTITSPVVQGSSTITYKCVGFDSHGGLTAASASGTVTNAPAVFGPLPVTISSITATGGVVTANFSAALNVTVVPGMTVHIVGVTGAGSTWNGIWVIASAPTTSQITFAVSGATGTGTVGAASTGRVSNSQQITAISRNASGLTTITTAQNHGYVAAGALHPTVILIENITPVDLNGWYIIQTASGNTITCLTGVLSAESGTVVPGSSSCTVWEYLTVACPVLSGTTVGYYIYSDSANPGGSLALIGKTIYGESHFTDWGPAIAAGYVAPGYVPTTPPGSAQNQLFTSIILSGGGTLNIVLNSNVPTSIPALGARLLYDNGPNLIAAMGAGGIQVVLSPPRTPTSNPGYVFNSPVNVPAGTTLTFSGQCFINETIFLDNFIQVNASFSTGDLPSIAFGQRNYVNVSGLANPMLCTAGQSGSINVDGLCFTCLSNGQIGFEVFNNSYNSVSNCAFTAAENFGTAIGLVLNGACTLFKISDCNFEMSNRFNGPGVAGQSSWGPPIPALLVRASDNANITSAGQMTNRFIMTGKNTGSGRGILFNQQYATVVSISGSYDIGESLWWQQGTTPIVAVWGQQFFSISLQSVLNDTSEAPCFASLASFGSSNVTLNTCSTNASFPLVSGQGIQALSVFQSSPPSYRPTLQRMTIASLVTAGGTSDLVVLPSYNNNGAVTLTPTNASAALDVAAGLAYISIKASGQVLVVHSATAGMTFDLTGAVNN